MMLVLENVHEVAGVGTLFPDDEGRPSLHMHISCGRKRETRAGCVRAGCVRQGVCVWHVMEIILIELIEGTGLRVLDAATGFKLLNP
jgi:predicted DNA-binding protein with PD1-like motif